MSKIFRYKNNQPVTWFNRSLSRSNQYCLYCGRLVGEGAVLESNKEHLIGRGFVPVGEFGSGDLFNFIFRACKKCNDEKSVLERHISSVTIFNSPVRSISQFHDNLAKHKASKDYHPTKQGILIKDSRDQFNITGKLGSTNLSFGIFGPPQADPEQIQLLAFRQVQGIFSLITSRNPLSTEGTMLLDLKYFYFHGSYVYLDWGN